MKADKIVGCGEDLGAYMQIPEEFQNSSDKIRSQHAYSVDIICGENGYCEVCKAKRDLLKDELEFIETLLDKLPSLTMSQDEDIWKIKNILVLGRKNEIVEILKKIKEDEI